MGFNSMDDIVSEITAGKFIRTDFNKITGAAAYTANRWYDFSMLNGIPVANDWAGTALTWTTCTGTSGNGSRIFGVHHDGLVTPDTKHIMNVAAVTGIATGVPGVLMLVDMQGYYPGINMNVATSQALLGSPTLRYANGAGVRAFLVSTVASGATAHNLSMSYTDQDNNSGNSMPVTVACTASAIAGHISHTGSAANNYGPFLPLASGDSGIRSVQSVQLSAASGAGTAALVLARPLLTLPITTVGIASERDLLNQLPSLPRVYDDACLTWIYFAGAATAASTNFYGSIECAWG